MRPLSFLLFLSVSHFSVLQIFRFSTYHAYFLRCVPLLLSFGIGCAWLLMAVNLADYFLYQFFGATGWLIYKGRSESRSASGMVSTWEGDVEELKFLVESINKTKWYFTASSICYLLSFFLGFLYLYNSK